MYTPEDTKRVCTNPDRSPVNSTPRLYTQIPFIITILSPLRDTHAHSSILEQSNTMHQPSQLLIRRLPSIKPVHQSSEPLGQKQPPYQRDTSPNSASENYRPRYLHANAAPHTSAQDSSGGRSDARQHQLQPAACQRNPVPLPEVLPSPFGHGTAWWVVTRIARLGGTGRWG